MTCPICGRLYCDHSPAEDHQSSGYIEKHREKLIARVNSGGGWFNGDENAATAELEEYDAQRYRTEHDTD